jgi:hypothetical protein
MKKIFKEEVKAGIERTSALQTKIITEKDLEHLPEIVQKYLHITGVVGKETVNNMKVVMTGKIRSNPKEPWMKLTATQFSFFDNSTRLYYIKASKLGIPVRVLHLYKNATASMTGKLFGLIKIFDYRGEKMNQAETVTMFNDMCLMAPSTLIDKNIKWQIIDPLTVRATFSNGNISIKADLIFNNNGSLVNFISYDRYAIDGKELKNYPWLTPVKEYSTFNDFKLASKASADYQTPDTTYSYAEFKLESIEYNCKK